MSNRPYFYAILFLLVSSCTSVAKSPPSPQTMSSPRQLNEASLGDTKEKVVSILGQPQSKSFEEFQTTKYEVWNYNNVDSTPIGFLNIDPKSGLVAGRAVWISNKQPEKDLSYVKAHIFPNLSFENFKTCDTHWGTTFKVNSQRGILVGIRRNEVFLIEWADSTLAQLWVQHLNVNCSKQKL